MIHRQRCHNYYYLCNNGKIYRHKTYIQLVKFYNRATEIDEFQRINEVAYNDHSKRRC